jgi:hypothetical protein
MFTFVLQTVAKEKVPKLDLSIASKQAQYGKNSGRANKNGKNSSSNTNNPTSHFDSRKTNKSQKDVTYSGRQKDKNIPAAPSPSKSPRASALADTLRYAQNSKSDSSNSNPPSPSTARTVYLQQKPTKLRSESAKARYVNTHTFSNSCH